mgnify:CR=1 FL=1
MKYHGIWVEVVLLTLQPVLLAAVTCWHTHYWFQIGETNSLIFCVCRGLWYWPMQKRNGDLILIVIVSIGQGFQAAIEINYVLTKLVAMYTMYTAQCCNTTREVIMLQQRYMGSIGFTSPVSISSYPVCETLMLLGLFFPSVVLLVWADWITECKG